MPRKSLNHILNKELIFGRKFSDTSQAIGQFVAHNFSQFVSWNLVDETNSSTKFFLLNYSLCTRKRVVFTISSVLEECLYYIPLVKSIISWGVIVIPFRLTTKANGSSPSMSWGRPTTATSSTSGWVIICSSIFVGTTCMVTRLTRWDGIQISNLFWGIVNSRASFCIWEALCNDQ